MISSYAIFLLGSFVLMAYGVDEKHFNQTDAENFLEQFGYLSGQNKRSGLAKINAIAAFQRFSHLPVTGTLDEDTKKAMLKPRCGLKDVVIKRAGTGPKWDLYELKWAFDKPTSQIDTKIVKAAIKQALDVWSKVVPLDFVEVSPQGPTDLLFGFAKRAHDTCGAFDGNGGVLAHAYFPKDGRLHFDDEEKWSLYDGAKIQEGSYTDLLWVLIHEIGHALGLNHMDQEASVMYPAYQAPALDSKGQIKPFVLNQLDIQAIQKLYGPRNGPVPTARPQERPLPTPSGAACPQFQAAMTGLDNATYFFNGNIGWKKTSLNGAPNSATPFYIDQTFPGVSRNGITAALSSKFYGIMILFQGRKVFQYNYSERRGRFTLEGEPQDLPSDLPFEPEGVLGLPSGHMVLYRGDQLAYYSHSYNSINGLGRRVQDDVGALPANTKAGFAVDNNQYFFDANNYHIFDFNAKKVVGTKPLKTLITC